MLKITFISGSWNNYHIIEFCKEINQIENVDFKFIATEKNPEWLKKFGQDKKTIYPFVIEAYKENGEQETWERMKSSDAVIIGPTSDNYIKDRLKDNKITFRYSERVNKRGDWTLLYIPKTIHLIKKHTKYRKRRLYMLCSSAYAKHDFALVGAYKNKCFKWGYFPKTPIFENVDEIIQKKEKNTINWTGRLIKWKHPEDVIKIAQKLKKDNYDFTINIIGEGELKDKLEEDIKKYNLQENVFLRGFLPTKDVYEYMKKSQIYMATSDYNEGWGAVVNEAMGNACAVVASKAMGSVPYLIKDGENGFTYKNGKINDLYDKIKRLLDNEQLSNNLSKHAYETINNIWNGKVYAQRFVKLVEEIMRGNDPNKLFKDGPCSKA